MTGYREHSFDPNAFEQPGPPLKPYNWLQWSGVAVVIAGAAVIFAEWFGKLGWIPRWIEDAGVAPVTFMILGWVMINSRRGPSTLVGSEQLEKNRRILIVTGIAVAAIAGIAAFIEFSGA